jgi:putative two-component system response regulator
MEISVEQAIITFHRSLMNGGKACQQMEKASALQDNEISKVLILDDEEPVSRFLQRLLEREGYWCCSAANGKEARKLLDEKDFDLVLCDVKMPGESGLDLAQFILRRNTDTAVLMVTGIDDPEVGKSILELGAYGYVIKPFKPGELLLNIHNILRRRKLEIEIRAHQQNLEKLVAKRTAEVQTALDKWRKATHGIVESTAHAVEARDPYTAGHQKRVAKIACAIARKLGLSQNRIEGLHMAALIHDLGKISIPAEILSKPSRLSEIEFSLVREHPKVGYDILRGIEFPWPLAEVVYQHHERINGSGYPRGLSGDKMLEETKILAVSDVIEAMASDRPYRPALGIEAAIEEISKNAGVLYDSRVFDAFMLSLKENGHRLGFQ